MTTAEATDGDVDIRGELESATEGSHAVALLRRAARAARNSRLAALATWLVHATTHSFLYRWLTKEPEPEVVVIDLRDTYSVGPIIAVLDRTVNWLAPIWRHSLLKRATDTLVALAETAAETRTGRTIAKLLEPPEPPGEK